MKILCFGDSNTYGYDPRGWLGGRYTADTRWVDRIAAQTGWTLCNLGENGREIPAQAPSLPQDVDWLLVMLGTNDLLQGRSPQAAADRLEHLLLPLDRSRVLLIAPPPLAPGAWVTDDRLIDDSRTFARCCQALAARLGIRFADAGAWNIALAYDGVHFTAQGHCTFATRLLEVLR